MPVLHVPYFQVACDRCGDNLTDNGDEISAWGERDFAIENAKDGGAMAWHPENATGGEIVLCQACCNAYLQPLSVDGDAWDAAADDGPEAFALVKTWLAASSEDQAQ